MFGSQRVLLINTLSTSNPSPSHATIPAPVKASSVCVEILI